MISMEIAPSSQRIGNFSCRMQGRWHRRLYHEGQYCGIAVVHPGHTTERRNFCVVPWNLRKGLDAKLEETRLPNRVA
jgi:hypothetical protein